jgi:hypothetical protein
MSSIEIILSLIMDQEKGAFLNRVMYQNCNAICGETLENTDGNGRYE